MDQTNTTEGPSYTLAEFCKLERMCPTTFYKIDPSVRPRVIKIPGTAVRIITSAERARYHARLEAWQRDHADELEAERRRRSEHFSVMGKRAFKSPKHPQHPGPSQRQETGEGMNHVPKNKPARGWLHGTGRLQSFSAKQSSYLA